MFSRGAKVHKLAQPNGKTMFSTKTTKPWRENDADDK
jgi:hypothetical protein